MEEDAYDYHIAVCKACRFRSEPGKKRGEIWKVGHDHASSELHVVDVLSVETIIPSSQSGPREAVPACGSPGGDSGGPGPDHPNEIEYLKTRCKNAGSEEWLDNCRGCFYVSDEVRKSFDCYLPELDPRPFDAALKEYMKIEDKTILAQMFFKCGHCGEIKSMEELLVKTREPTVETETTPQGDVKGVITGGVGLFCRSCLTGVQG